MESMSDGEKRTMIAIRLLSAAVVIFVFAGATAIKKSSHGSNDNKGLFEIAFMTDVNKKASDTVAKENDDPEVPVTAVPEEKVEEKVEEKPEEKPEVQEAPAQAAPQYTTRTVRANASNNAPSPASRPNPNYPSNYDAGSPYAGQVYVDGGEAPELHNPTYYDIPGGNPNVVVEEPEPVTPAPAEEPEE